MRYFVAFAAALALALSAAADEPAAVPEKPKAAEKPKATSLFDGKTLGDWKESGFSSQSRVAVKDGNLVIGTGEGCNGVTYKGKFPTTNYELHVEAMRVDGGDFFCGLTFPVARPARGDKKAETQPCTLVVGGWGGGVVGLSSIDGSDASENPTSGYQEFESGKWYKIRLRVTEPKIEAWIDDTKVVDFALADRELSIRIEVDESKPLGIATYQTTGAIRKIEYVKVDKPDTPPAEE